MPDSQDCSAGHTGGYSPHFSHPFYCIGAMLRSDRVAVARPPQRTAESTFAVTSRRAPCPSGPSAASRRPCVRKAGYTLVETMVASAVSVIVLAGFFSMMGMFQTWSSNLSLLLERDSNFWLAPPLLTRWILPAGNNRWDQAWSGIAIKADRLELRSDIDGPEGFPDLKLSSSFESVALRSFNSNLRVQSNKGAFQPLLKNVADFQVEPKGKELLLIRLRAITDRPLSMIQKDLSESSELLFCLRNYRSNLFPENP